jgi:hypothetical protein
MVLERVVEIVHVSGVMLVVMDLHRARVNVRLEGVECVGKWWNGVGHRVKELILTE